MVTPQIVQNPSFAQSSKYTLSFMRLPHMVYFLQTTNLPGVSMTDIPRHTPFVDLYVFGDKLVYDTLNVTFLLDEDLKSWFELYDWFKGLTFPTKFEDHRTFLKENKNMPYSDAILTLNTNANRPNVRLKLKDCFPISLASIQFDNTVTADLPLVVDASFRFSYYEYERLTSI